MATLEEMKAQYQDDIASVTHLLVIGPTKSGKSDYLAQAAIDGFTILYFENDNGLATLLACIGDNKAALNRVHYFNPLDFTGTIEAFCKDPVFRYNERTRKVWASMNSQSDDMVTVIYPSRVPRSVILSIDSWTTLMYSIVKDKAKALGVNLLDIEKYSREIYGGAGFHGTQIAQLIQLLPINTVVQAHPSVYEIKSKPPGVVRDVKEQDMIIKETWDVPKSTSNPHGFSIGQYFNQIGWLAIDRWDKYVLDFKPKGFRIGGGTPNGMGDPRKEYRYAKLFGVKGMVEAVIDPNRPWIEKLTSAELSARNKPASKPAGTPGTATPIVEPKLIGSGTTAQPKPAVKLGGLKLS